MKDIDESRMIDRWFPVAAVDDACRTPEGSGQNEKAIFTWFASRPIAQARAAVLCSLLEDSPESRTAVNTAVRTGDTDVIENLSKQIVNNHSKKPVVLDCFSGRGIIPLEAARLGLRAVGVDLSPVAVLASRLLADWPLQNWDREPSLPFKHISSDQGSEALFVSPEARLLVDVRSLLHEVGIRVEKKMSRYYPKNQLGNYPWGTLWATTIPCDACKRRFPLIGSLVLRNPYKRTYDPGQALRIHADTESGTWHVEVFEGIPTDQPTFTASAGRRGKSARCPFAGCHHVHSLDAVKSKGFAKQYQDAPIATADIVQILVPGRKKPIERKVFRTLDEREIEAATDPSILDDLESFGDLTPVPNERIPSGSNDTIRALGYGFLDFGSLMNRRQARLFAETVRAIRECHAELLPNVSPEYAKALTSYACANLVRCLRAATRGVRLQAVGKTNGSEQNRNKVGDIFVNQSSIGYGLDFFEVGVGTGPGTWSSRAETMLRPLEAHLERITALAQAGKFRISSATALPYRDSTVDVVVTDPPYYSMIEYADASDLFYVWLKRCLFDILPELFGNRDHLQNTDQEIIVSRRSGDSDPRDAAWYEKELSVAFGEMRRVLKPEGRLLVVFGHSDPAAWRRLLGAVRDAGFVVTSAWPARTESGETGVASIKVTVTIGCRPAPSERPTALANHVEREIVELIRDRQPKWDDDHLAVSDQLMASYGPAMEVVGRYRRVLSADGSEPDLNHFLSIGRRAAEDTMAIQIEKLPLETFDKFTRFAIFWIRAFGRTPVNKGEAVFHSQASELSLADLRGHLLVETKSGYVITLDAPPSITERSSVIHIVRALAAAWPTGGTEEAATVLADAVRDPDDAHIWATISDLVQQLPDSDKIAKALTACQRNRRPIVAMARSGLKRRHPSQSVLELPFDE